MLGLRFCARAFSSCGERGPLFIAVCRPLTIAASLVAEHRLQTRRLSSCGSRAQLVRGMWDPPRPGLEPVSPALAGRFSTTAPPGRPLNMPFKIYAAYNGRVMSHSVCNVGWQACNDCLQSVPSKQGRTFSGYSVTLDGAAYFTCKCVEVYRTELGIFPRI